MYRKQSKFPPVLFILCLALICFSARPTPLLSQDLIPQLIDELASRQFSTRQRAMATLIQLGPDVVPQLEEAMTNGNRELRFRAQRVLDAVDQNLYQLQLEAFMQSGEKAATLPGWDGFKQLLEQFLDLGESPSHHFFCFGFVDMILQGSFTILDGLRAF